jgi:alpha-beta hydrolase superfamily lysophospholipase
MCPLAEEGVMEETFTLLPAVPLFARAWVPETPVQGVVCLVHGLGKHSGRYAPLAARLNAGGFAVLAFDLRGHGRSGGKRGHFVYADALDDVARLVGEAQRRFGDAPRFLYGHSLGGNLVLNYVLRRPSENLRGAIASGPWLRLAFEPPAYKVFLARSVGKLWPTLLQPSGLQPKDLSHDPAVVKAYVEDPLVHDRISAGMFLEAYQAGLWALEHAADLGLPVLLMHGSEDRLTSAEASREFCQRAGGQCTFRLWEGMYHEVHNEVGKEEVYCTVLDWLTRH